MLRLLFVGDPAAIHVQRWVRYFCQAGHEVHLIPYPDSFSEVPLGTFEGVRIHNLQRGEFRRRMSAWCSCYKKYLILENIFRIRRLLNQNDFDILHAHYISACGWTGAWAGFNPFVLTAWGSDVNVDPHRSPLYRYLTRLAIRRADLITANSNNLKDKLIELGAVQKKIQVIQGGLELEKFPFKRGNDCLRRQLGLHQEKVVLSTRMLGKVYNLDIVAKSIPLVLAEVPDVKFIFIYRGQQEQEEELKRLIQELGVLDAVLLIGPVDNNRIAEYYHLADVLVSVTSSEGMPGSLTEAMACGAVAVVSDLPFVKEWIRHNVNGLVVPVRNSNALAQAIVTLLRDPRKLLTMAQLNQKLVAKQADHRKWMKQVEHTYLELSSKKRT